MSPSKTKKSVSLRMEEDVLRAVQARANANGRTVSEEVRDLVIHGLSRVEEIESGKSLEALAKEVKKLRKGVPEIQESIQRDLGKVLSSLMVNVAGFEPDLAKKHVLDILKKRA